MNMDIEIEKQNYRFKYRVSGILIKNDRVLCVRINNNKFFCLPGGHVELNEDTIDAIIREFKEETGIDVYVKRLLYVVENFFDSNNVKCHELGFYYLLDTKDNININNFTKIEWDNTYLEFKWLDINSIANFKPEFLKNNVLNNLPNKLEHIIIKNNKIIEKNLKK